ncbi:MAG: hypothetical protein Q4C47_09800, partial [Planctomycetia bacterium]|nr:hypothetical protein [Planctomycetia bacterium]
MIVPQRTKWMVCRRGRMIGYISGILWWMIPVNLGWNGPDGVGAQDSTPPLSEQPVISSTPSTSGDVAPDPVTSTTLPVDLPVVTVDVPLQLPPPPPSKPVSSEKSSADAVIHSPEPPIVSPDMAGNSGAESDPEPIVVPELATHPESSPSSTISAAPAFHVAFTRAQTVCTPGEVVPFQVGPFPSEIIGDGQSLRLKWSVTRVDELSHQANSRAQETGGEWIPDGASVHHVAIPVGDREGVYEIRFDVVSPGGILYPRGSTLTRTLRVPVVSEDPFLPDSGRSPASSNRAKSVTERYTRTGQSRIVDPLSAGMAVVLATYTPTEPTVGTSLLPDIPSLPDLRPRFLRNRGKDE